jgi:hypothetical protein
MLLSAHIICRPSHHTQLSFISSIALQFTGKLVVNEASLFSHTDPNLIYILYYAVQELLSLLPMMAALAFGLAVPETAVALQATVMTAYTDTNWSGRSREFTVTAQTQCCKCFTVYPSI